MGPVWAVAAPADGLVIACDTLVALEDRIFGSITRAKLIEAGFALEIGFDDPLTSTLVHTRATSFCIEPQSAWPTAIALEAAGVPGTGLANLDAGDRLAASMAWLWRTA